MSKEDQFRKTKKMVELSTFHLQELCLPKRERGIKK